MKTDPVENSHPSGKLFKYLQVEEAFEKYDIGGKRLEIFLLKTVQIYFIFKTGLQGILSDDSRRTERIIPIVYYIV